MDSERDAYGIDVFCKQHGISRAFLYLLWRRGTGPRFMRIGTRRLISREAASTGGRQWNSPRPRSHKHGKPPCTEAGVTGAWISLGGDRSKSAVAPAGSSFNDDGRASRSRLLYGVWQTESGDEILFDRQYRPRWRRTPNGTVVPADPSEWIVGISGERWFYTERADLPTRKRVTMHRTAETPWCAPALGAPSSCAILPRFQRISTKQRYVLKEIADRVLGVRQ